MRYQYGCQHGEIFSEELQTLTELSSMQPILHGFFYFRPAVAETCFTASIAYSILWILPWGLQKWHYCHTNWETWFWPNTAWLLSPIKLQIKECWLLSFQQYIKLSEKRGKLIIRLQRHKVKKFIHDSINYDNTTNDWYI